MRNKVVLLLALFVVTGVVLLWVQRPSQNTGANTSPPLPAPNSAADARPGPAQPGHDDHDHAHEARPSRPAARPALSPEELWAKPAPEPAFAAFKGWVNQYQAATTAASRAGLEAEGAALARERLATLAGLIASDPERALELAVPDSIRRELPGQVQALLEERVDATADYEVVCVTPFPGQRAAAPLIRSARIDGVMHRIFTYGQGLDYVTRRSMPVRGVTVPLTAATTPPADPSHLRPVRLMAMSVPTDGSDAGFDVPQPPDNLPTAQSSYTEGRKRYLLMRVDFPDFIGDVFPTNAALTHMVDMSNFLAQISYNRHIIAPVGKGSAITPVMRMANNVSFYDNKGLSDLYPEARAVAQNVHGYDLSEFDFFFVCTGAQPSYGYAGLGYVGGVGYHLANSYFDVRTSAHELGHNLGLSHANWWETDDRSSIGPGNNQEYGDPFDTMGGSGGGIRHFSASFKARLDWIPASDTVTVTTSGVYRVHAHDITTAPFGVRAVRLNRPTGNPYWIEFRQLWTANKALMNGVSFRWASGSSQLLDMTAGSSSGKDDASLTIGRTFSDWANNYHVTALRKGNTWPESIDLAINLGPFPANRPPSVVARASTVNAAAGQAITFTATATDPDGDTLAYAWDFGDGDYSVDNSASVTRSFPNAGEYYVEVTVSDMKGGVSRDAVIINVGSPTTFSISGRVLNHDGRPLTGVRVAVSPSRYAFSESDGTYTITRLAGGSYTVTAIEPVADSLVFANPFFTNPVNVGPDFNGADFIVNTNPAAVVTPLITVNSAWKYLDNGSDQGSAWRAPGFNDAGWASGNGVLGYTDGNDQIDTTISFGPNSAAKYITYYFRRAFNISSPADFTSLQLRALNDDGVVVYLNGTEIYRNNMPAGTPSASTTASGTAPEPLRYLQQSLTLNGLVAGNNVIAAEIHQAGASSSDVAFDLALDGLTATNSAAFNLVYLSSPQLLQTFVNPAAINLAAEARSTAGTATRVDFYANGVKVGEDAVAPYTAVWPGPGAGTHTLAAVAVFGSVSVTSAPVQIVVTAPPALGIELTAPAAGTTFTLPADVNLTASVQAGPAAITGVKFFVDGSLIDEDITPPYTATFAESIPGARQLLAVATDLSGNSATSAPVSVSFAQPVGGTQIISFGESWRYLDDGSNQGLSWKNIAFDDRAWAIGTGRFGYGGDGETTVVSFGPNVNQRHITTYFRKSFQVPNPGSFAGLLLRLLRDDGAIVYLNGTEILRDNVLAGVVSWNSLASSSIEGPGETTPLERRLGTSLLRAGTNVIAVEIHQSSTNGADLGFDLALVGLDPAPPAADFYLVQPAGGARFTLPAPVPFASYFTASAGVPSSVDYYANGSLIGTGAGAPAFNLNWANAPAGAYSLTAVANWPGLSLTSAPVDISVANALPRVQPAASTLLSRGSTWRYWDNAIGVAPGWQNRDFDDSAWPSGPARLGWGLDGEITPLTEGRITHYFRRWISVPAPAFFTELELQLARDDGAIVYLNGVEVFRSNLPEGTVTATTLASTSVNTPDETTYYEATLPTSGSGLVQGTNLIAVELHQSSATSSDGGFDLQINAYGTSEGRVYLTKPRGGSAFSGSPNIELEAIAKGAGSFAVTNVEFFVNGQKLGESAAVPWRLTWSNAPLGVFSLTARSADAGGYSFVSPPIEVAIGRERVTTTFIPSNSVWKFLDTGVNQGTAWVNASYNDAAWRSGPARLGFGNDGEATPVNGGPSNARYPTIYFRKSFVVQPGAVYTNLTFKIARDDGAVVYLNGVEMFRSNMPDGPVLYSTLAFGADDEQTFFPTSIAIPGLPAGTNFVAVEVHQSSATSSDLGFNLELTASGYEDAASPPTLTITLADGLIEIRWPATAVNWQVQNALAIDAPAGSWAAASGTLTQVGGENVFKTSRGGLRRFFRLAKP